MKDIHQVHSSQEHFNFLFFVCIQVVCLCLSRRLDYILCQLAVFLCHEFVGHFIYLSAKIRREIFDVLTGLLQWFPPPEN